MAGSGSLLGYCTHVPSAASKHRQVAEHIAGWLSALETIVPDLTPLLEYFTLLLIQTSKIPLDIAGGVGGKKTARVRGGSPAQNSHNRPCLFQKRHIILAQPLRCSKFVSTH